MMGTPLNNHPPFVKTLCPEPKPFLPLLLTARDWFSAGKRGRNTSPADSLKYPCCLERFAPCFFARSWNPILSYLQFTSVFSSVRTWRVK